MGIASNLIDLFLGLRDAQGLLPVDASRGLPPPADIQQAGRIDPAQMGFGAGPLVLGRLFDHFRSDWILFDIPQRPPEVLLAQRTGVEAILPEVSAAAVQAVDVLCIAKMGASQRFGQGVGVGWTCDQVNVIGHQAPAENLQAVFVGVFFEQGKIDPAVVIDEEDVLPVIAPLCDVVRDIRDRDSCSSRHSMSILHRAKILSRKK